MAISKKAASRLMRLIEFMEALPRSANRHFDMQYVVAHKGEAGLGEHQINPKDISVKYLHSCGTTACALGWACAMPYFKRLGLTFSLYEWHHTPGIDRPEIFDLDSVDADAWEELFGPENKDKTPKQWAKRARKLLRAWQ